MIIQHQSNNLFFPGAFERQWMLRVVNMGQIAASPPPPLPSPLAKKQLLGVVDDPEIKGIIPDVELEGG